MDPVETPGAALKREREAQGISVAELAAITRISQRSLESLESDRYEDLPAEVYVRGFIRNCARELKLDDADLIASFDRLMGKPPLPPSEPGEEELADSTMDSLLESRRLLPTSYIIAILAIILGLSLSILIFGSSGPEQLSDADRGADVTAPFESP